MIQTVNSPRDNALPTYRSRFETFGDGSGSHTMPKATDVLLDAWEQARDIKEKWIDYGLGGGPNIQAIDLVSFPLDGLPWILLKTNGIDVRYSLSDWGLQTLCNRIECGGASYFKNVLDNGLDADLVSTHLNEWFAKREHKKLALRVYDDVIMAVVSPQFTPFDHIEVLEGFLTNFSIYGGKGWLVDRIVLDPHNFEMRLINPNEVIVEGDQTAVGGIVIRNGQTAQRKFNVDFYCYTFHCKNGLFFGPGSNVYSKVHRGLDKVYVTDVLHRLTEEYFPRFINKAKKSIAKATEMEISVANDEEVKKVIKQLRNLGNINEKEAQRILELNIEKYDQTHLGLANAITEFAQNYEDYTKQFQIEQVAARLVK